MGGRRPLKSAVLLPEQSGYSFRLELSPETEGAAPGLDISGYLQSLSPDRRVLLEYLLEDGFFNDRFPDADGFFIAFNDTPRPYFGEKESTVLELAVLELSGGTVPEADHEE